MGKLKLLIFIILFSSAVNAQFGGNVSAELIADVKSVQPGKNFTAAVKLVMNDGWHTYWRNPGDAGLATSIKWDLPDGFIAGNIKWPFPHEFDAEGVVSFGYEEEVLLFVEITPPSDLKSNEITLKASVNWLECKVACLPGNADLSLTLPVENKAIVNKNNLELFRNFKNMLPKDDNEFTLEAVKEGDVIILKSGNVKKAESIKFFPYDESVYDYEAPDNLNINNGTAELTLYLARMRVKTPENVNGILVINNNEAYKINVTVKNK